MKKYIAAAAAVTALLAAPVWAQDAEDEELEEEPPATSPVAEYDNDAGLETMVKAQEEQPSAVPAPDPKTEGFKSARDVVQGILDEDGIETDGEKSLIAVVGAVQTKLTDPSSRDDFSTIRDMMYLRAYLNAKANIIKAIDLKFEAFDRASLTTQRPASPEEAAWAAKKAELETKREKLAKQLAILDAKEAAALEGVTVKDQFGKLLDGLIKKVDASYDAGEIAAEKKADYEAFKAQCNALEAEFNALREEAEKLPKFPKNETESDIKMLAKMPLVGASIYCQSESWDPSSGAYQVALGCIWSPKLQEQAEKTMTTGSFDAGTKGDQTAKEWFKAQDLSAMIGARRIVDDRGRILYIGVGTAVEPDDPSDIEAAEAFAETEAIHSIAMSLLGDMETYREVHQNYREYEGGTSAATRNLAQTTTQKIKANLSGCNSLGTKTVRNTISGKRMIVNVMFLDPGLAKNAAELMKQSYAAAAAIDRANKYKAGLHAGMEQSYENAKKDPTAFNQGKAAGKKAVDDELSRKPPASAAVPGISNKSSGSGAAKEEKAAPQGGSFSGDTKSSRKNFGL